MTLVARWQDTPLSSVVGRAELLSCFGIAVLSTWLLSALKTVGATLIELMCVLIRDMWAGRVVLTTLEKPGCPQQVLIRATSVYALT